MNPFWRPRESSYLRIAIGTSMTTTIGFTLKYIYRYFKDNPAILESQFENTISGIISNMRHLKFFKVCVLFSLSYYTMHELVFHYFNNYCGISGNYWLTHSITGLMAYKCINRATFNLKMGRLLSSKIYLLQFLIFNGLAEIVIRRERLKLIMSYDEYRALEYHIGLRIEGKVIIQEYTEEEKQYLKECEEKTMRNISEALRYVKQINRK